MQNPSIGEPDQAAEYCETLRNEAVIKIFGLRLVTDNKVIGFLELERLAAEETLASLPPGDVHDLIMATACPESAGEFITRSFAELEKIRVAAVKAFRARVEFRRTQSADSGNHAN
jgi:hypothetical protein